MSPITKKGMDELCKGKCSYKSYSDVNDKWDEWKEMYILYRPHVRWIG